MDIIDKAKELGEMIAASQEMNDYRACEESVKNDTNANKLMVELTNTQKKFQSLHHSGCPEAELNELKIILEEMAKVAFENVLIKEYFEATEKFNSLMRNVNETISYGISGEECSKDDCSGCGGGCHH